MDVFNGCGRHCDTCYADSALPSKMFSYDSLNRLFSDDRFIQMLQPDSVRFGSSGDILEHPQAIEIIEMVLQKTVSLDTKRVQETKGINNFQVKIFTNYRPNAEIQLDKLIDIAKNNKERIDVVISLPFNRKDTINEKFMDYIKARPNIFKNDDQVGEDGLLKKYYNSELQNITIMDTRHPEVLYMSGRVLSKEANANRVKDFDLEEVDRKDSFYSRGFTKTYLNPDALWLMIYATPYESHTTKVFTPITSQNINVLSKIPYHSDFPVPQNWLGGKGQIKKWSYLTELQKEARTSGRPMKPNTIIG
jgi:hypothetical protein